MQTVRVALGERSYPIYIGSNIISSVGELCGNHSMPNRLAVITDKTVARLYLRQITNTLRHCGYQTTAIVIPTGERQKSLARARYIYEQLLKREFHRASALIALGGGVVGDLTGYVAATFRRGVPYVQIPTTLLGQVESGLGGKVGVNHLSRKNAVGAFYQPRFVCSDVNLLLSLPPREITCGLGELVKYAYLNEELFTLISENLDHVINLDLHVLQEIIARCNSLKAAMVSADEHELNPAGGRRVLNLGHTIGHALEVLSNYRLRHGEAVVVGLRWELSIAAEGKFIGRPDFEKLDALLGRIPYQPDIDYIRNGQILSAVFGKKPRSTFIIPRAIGKIDAVEIERALVESVLKKKLFHAKTQRSRRARFQE